MERFVVISNFEAQEKGYPVIHDYSSWDILPRYWRKEYCGILYETDGEKPIRFVAADGGEPEDQRLARDWKWVPEELNKLAQEVEELRSFKRSVDEALNSGDGSYRP